MIHIRKKLQNAVVLHKIHEEHFFSELVGSSDFDQHCNGIDNNLSSKRREIKYLCIKLARNSDKLSQSGESERTNYFKYIGYCLYERISEIHTNKSAKIAKVRFFDKFILPWIVMKNYKIKLKKVSTYENRTDCDNYLTYLESFKPVHDGYKDKHCMGLIDFSSNGTNYFPCNDRDILTSCKTELEKCKFITSTKAINLRTNIIFSGITNFVKFIKNIGYQIFNQYSDYNKCVKCKMFESYINHKYTKFISFNKFNRSCRSRRINTYNGCRSRTWKICDFSIARIPWAHSSHSVNI
ncbi:CYIR protein [Plasmodium cynomolgi strain B]|uniref:CYIR protein n=1 Tax=Plasmodium cynomolgi (strain B) TaxID=1120755 RepID=K6VJT4_PLACD|nr:CYIR protein [Plasmodium cynomolgi strain B]GAB69682.1 CYIR protein [Plasmodium cynomolgi strain B]